MSKTTQEENDNFFDSLSEHDQTLMKMAAAKITGVDTSGLEVQQALELFQNHHIDMDMDPIIDAVSKNIIEEFKSILAPDDMEALTKSLLTDDFKTELTETAESMAKTLQFERAFAAMSAEEEKFTEPAAGNFSKVIQVKMGNSVINRLIEDALTDTCIDALNSVFNFFQSDEWKEKIEEAKEKATGKQVPRALLPEIGTPGKFYYSNTLIDNSIKSLVNDGAYNMPVFGQKSNISTYVNIVMQPAEDLKITGMPLKEYDLAVMYGAYSIFWEKWRRGETVDYMGAKCVPITARAILRTLSQSKNKNHFKEITIKDCEESLIKLNQYVRCDIDFSSEYEYIRRHSKNEDLLSSLPNKPKDFLLPGKFDERKPKRGAVENVLFLQMPPLLLYAEKTNKLIGHNGDVLNIREINKGLPTNKSISVNYQRIAIRNYLIRRIDIAKEDFKRASQAAASWNKSHKEKRDKKTADDYKNNYDAITFATLFNEIEIFNKVQQSRSKAYIFQCLDYWKAISYIKDYKIIKKVRSDHAIKLFF